MPRCPGSFGPPKNRLWSTGKIDHPDYRELTHRVSSTLAIIEATYLKVKYEPERAEYERGKEEKQGVN